MARTVVGTSVGPSIQPSWLNPTNGHREAATRHSMAAEAGRLEVRLSSGSKRQLWLPGAVHTWHFSDTAFVLGDVRSQGLSGNHLLFPSISPFDPLRTLPVWGALAKISEILRRADRFFDSE